MKSILTLGVRIFSDDERRAFWRIIRIPLLFLAIFGPGVAYSAWNYQVYSWRDYQIYLAMKKEIDPVWEEFNFRRIGPGADLEEVVRSTKPTRIKIMGDFTILNYGRGGFSGIGATAYKGRLVEAAAGSCCWSKTFFDVRSEEEKALFAVEYEAYMKPILDRWARQEKEEQIIEAVIAAAPWWCLP